VRSATGHTLVPLGVLVDALWDRGLAGERPGTVTVLDALAVLRALGCERADALLAREERRPR